MWDDKGILPLSSSIYLIRFFKKKNQKQTLSSVTQSGTDSVEQKDRFVENQAGKIFLDCII